MYFSCFSFCVCLDKQQRSQYNDVIIYEVINFMQIFFNIKAHTLMVYPCAKFHCDGSPNNEDTGGGGRRRRFFPFTFLLHTYNHISIDGSLSLTSIRSGHSQKYLQGVTFCLVNSLICYFMSTRGLRGLIQHCAIQWIADIRRRSTISL